MPKPLVSVVMPCYNEELNVGKAIDSILAQTFVDYEFIIFDDCSTDNTANIIKDYASKDSRIVFVQNEKNLGYAASLNRGIEMCKADIIARMDADDLSYPTRFLKQYDFLKKNTDISVVGTSARLIDSSTNKIINDCHLHEKHDTIVKNRYTRSFNFHPSIMARKALFEDMGGYDTTILRSEEYHLWLRSYKKFKFHNLQEVLIDYTVRSSADLMRWKYFKSALSIKLSHMRENEGVFPNLPVIFRICIGYILKRTLKKVYW